MIVGRKPGAHLTDLQHPWRRIRARAELDDVRIHDLRRYLRVPRPGPRRKLSDDREAARHTQVQTTARNAHLARHSIQNAAARVTATIGSDLLPDTGAPPTIQRIEPQSRFT